MNEDVFRAILAMDSYNRGYDQAINGLANVGAIGSATINQQSAIQVGSDARNAGFYAIAYNWTHDGITETVIRSRH